MTEEFYLSELTPEERQKVMKHLSQRVYFNPSILMHLRLITWSAIGRRPKTTQAESIFERSMSSIAEAYDQDLEDYRALTGLSQQQVVLRSLAGAANLSGWKKDEETGLFIKQP